MLSETPCLGDSSDSLHWAAPHYSLESSTSVYFCISCTPASRNCLKEYAYICVYKYIHSSYSFIQQVWMWADSSSVEVQSECQQLPEWLVSSLLQASETFLLCFRENTFSSTAVVLCSTRVTGEEGRIFLSFWCMLVQTMTGRLGMGLFEIWGLFLGWWDLSIRAQVWSEWEGRVAACLAAITVWLNAPQMSLGDPDSSC